MRPYDPKKFKKNDGLKLKNEFDSLYTCLDQIKSNDSKKFDRNSLDQILTNYVPYRLISFYEFYIKKILSEQVNRTTEDYLKNIDKNHIQDNIDEYIENLEIFSDKKISISKIDNNTSRFNDIVVEILKIKYPKNIINYKFDFFAFFNDNTIFENELNNYLRKNDNGKIASLIARINKKRNIVTHDLDNIFINKKELDTILKIFQIYLLLLPYFLDFIFNLASPEISAEQSKKIYNEIGIKFIDKQSGKKQISLPEYHTFVKNLKNSIFRL